MFVDIEFNRKGPDPKKVRGIAETVRPDIIVHNRKNGHPKENVLVVECKWCSAAPSALTRDTNKIKKLMRDPDYAYQYGLRVVYSTADIRGVLYFHDNGQIKEQPIG